MRNKPNKAKDKNNTKIKITSSPKKKKQKPVDQPPEKPKATNTLELLKRKLGEQNHDHPHKVRTKGGQLATQHAYKCLAI